MAILNFTQSRTVLLEILVGIRAHMTRPSITLPNVDTVIQIASILEALRVRVSAAGRHSGPMPITYAEQILVNAVQLRDHPGFSLIADRRWRVPAPRGVSEFAKRFGDEDVSVRDALARFIEVLGEVSIEDDDLFSPVTKLQATERLIGIVPDQKVAPVQFAITSDERLIVIHQADQPSASDEANVAAAREVLLEQGANIVESLLTSNCDPRLLQAMVRLNERLQDMTDVVQLGIQNISCEELRSSFEPELPVALAAIMKGHSAAINLYVAQFPEWQKFADNANQVELSPDDIRELKDTAALLAQQLEDDENVDPEVPATIKFLADAVSDPARVAKRTSFALLRSLENLISVVFKFVGEAVEETANEAKKNFTKTTGKVLAGYAALVVVSALSILPVFSKFADTSWIKSAAPLVKLLLDLGK